LRLSRRRIAVVGITSAGVGLVACATGSVRMTVISSGHPEGAFGGAQRLVPSPRVAPEYPRPLLLVGVQGDAVIRVVISRRGQVDTSRIEVLSATNPAFIRPSRTAAAALIGRPAKRNGRAITDSLPVRFAYTMVTCRDPGSRPSVIWHLDSVPAVIETRRCHLPLGWKTTREARLAMQVPPMDWAISSEAARLGLKDLRKGLPAGEAEVRIWNGFGLTGVQLIRAIRSGPTWTTVEYDNVRSVPNPIRRPWISGACWTTRWTSAAARTFSRIPASPFYPHGQPVVNDGYGVVIEAADGAIYHAAGVMNEGRGKSPNDHQLSAFAKTLLNPAPRGC